MNKTNGCLGRKPKKKEFLFFSWDSYLPHEWEFLSLTFWSWWETEWFCPHCERIGKVTHRGDQSMMEYHKLLRCPSKSGIATYFESNLVEYRKTKSG